MIGTIENAIIDKIKGLSDSGALGYKLRQVKTYGGEARDQKARALIKDFPALWLAFDGADVDQETSGFDRFRARFVLLGATENLRNEKSARHGGNGDVGVYQIMTDMAGILAGHSPDNDAIGKITIERIRPLSVEDERNGRLAVYGLFFYVPFQNKRITPGVDLDNPLEIIHTNWDLAPNGEVGPDLPDDENANATSHVTGD